ncbi:MAG: hypothetical protein BA863_00215 [Desulfovibrio sp. S3730MH75]|nr:MAG: hypothetical protein BA863_00215 [Desulfovibrio sp. S3730MH75]
MWKTIIILIAVLFLSMPSVISQAEEPAQGNTSLRANRNEAKSQLKGTTGPSNDVILSDGVSAGFIFGLDSTRPVNKHGLDDKDKGYRLGLGFSFSF